MVRNKPGTIRALAYHELEAAKLPSTVKCFYIVIDLRQPSKICVCSKMYTFRLTTMGKKSLLDKRLCPDKAKIKLFVYTGVPTRE